MTNYEILNKNATCELVAQTNSLGKTIFIVVKHCKPKLSTLSTFVNHVDNINQSNGNFDKYSSLTFSSLSTARACYDEVVNCF